MCTHDLIMHPPKMMAQLMDLAEKAACAEETLRYIEQQGRRSNGSPLRIRDGSTKNKRKKKIGRAHV